MYFRDKLATGLKLWLAETRLGRVRGAFAKEGSVWVPGQDPGGQAVSAPENEHLPSFRGIQKDLAWTSWPINEAEA